MLAHLGLISHESDPRYNLLNKAVAMDLYSIKMLKDFGDAEAFRRLFERLSGQWLVS